MNITQERRIGALAMFSFIIWTIDLFCYADFIIDMATVNPDIIGTLAVVGTIGIIGMFLSIVPLFMEK